MSDRARLRLVVLRVLVLSLVATLFGRLWYVQVLAGSNYVAAARSNQIREIVTPSARGAILDDQGRPLVRNKGAYVVTVDTAVLRRQHDRGAAVLGRLARVIGVPARELKLQVRLCGGAVKAPCYTGSPYQPVPVKSIDTADPLALSAALAIREQQELFPGVAVTLQAVRTYPFRALAAHSLGYLGPISATDLKSPLYGGYRASDLVGRGGLEQQYDRLLRGTPGVQQVTVNSAGTPTGSVSTTAAVAGDSLVLNLDAAVQAAVERELAAAIRNAEGQGYKGSSAVGVVLDPRDGAVLALASLPSYDPSVFVGGVSSSNYAALSAAGSGDPLVSRATQGLFAPGSTFKGVSTSAILSSGIANQGTYTPCPSAYQVGNFTFHNFEGEAAAPLTFHDALRISCDTVYYKYAYDEWVRDGGLRATPSTAAKPDNEIFVSMARAFGIGSRTRVDLPEETAGVVIDRANKIALWKARRADYCAGARRRPAGSYLQQVDAENCTAGYLYTAGEAVDFAIGQGFDLLLSPLQLADAYAAIANGGTLYAPRLGRALLAPDGRHATAIPPQVRGHVPVAGADLAYIRDALRAVVTSGTASGAGFPAALDVGGKTGTADTSDQPTSWFVSMQPVAAPRYVVLVMVQNAGQGAKVAAPAVANIYKDIYGLNGAPALFPHGVRPNRLPGLARDGVITAPLGTPPPVAPQAPLPGGLPALALGAVPAVLSERRTGAPAGPTWTGLPL